MIEWFNKLDTHDAYTFTSMNMEKYHFKICNMVQQISLFWILSFVFVRHELKVRDTICDA